MNAILLLLETTQTYEELRTQGIIALLVQIAGILGAITHLILAFYFENNPHKMKVMFLICSYFVILLIFGVYLRPNWPSPTPQPSMSPALFTEDDWIQLAYSQIKNHSSCGQPPNITFKKTITDNKIYCLFVSQSHEPGAEEDNYYDPDGLPLISSVTFDGESYIPVKNGADYLWLGVDCSPQSNLGNCWSPRRPDRYHILIYVHKKFYEKPLSI